MEILVLALPYHAARTNTVQKNTLVFSDVYMMALTQIPPKAQKEIISDTAVDPGLTFPQALATIIPRDRP
jgi:hypothetical protein